MSPLPNSQRSGPSCLLSVLAILLIGAICYLVGLSTAEFDKEEARRAVPAREMLASGDFVVPTVWQRTYLAKPPLLYWTIAGVGEVRGRVDELTARLPSVLATLLTALSLLAFGRRVLGARTGLIAGLLMLVSLGTFEKGALAELEASLALYVFAATAFLWLALEHGTTRFASAAFTMLASLALAAAAMTKGPVALLFYGAALAGLVVARRQPRLLLRAACWLPVVVSIATLGTWAAMALARVDSSLALNVWAGELARSKDFGLSNYLDDRQNLIIGALMAFFPGSWLCLAAWFGQRRSATDASARQAASEGENPALRFLAVALVVSFAFFLLQPGARPRFYYPALPSCALLGGHVLARALSAVHVGQRLVRFLVIFVTMAAIVLIVGGLALHATPIAGLKPPDMLGHLLMAAVAVAVVWTLRQLGKPVTGALLVGPLLMLTGARLMQTTQVVPQQNAQRLKQTFGAKLDRMVPEGEAIDVRFWFGFNELSYSKRNLVHTEPTEPIAGQRFVLAMASQIEALRANTEHQLIEVASLRLLKGTDVRLLEVR